jgi:hypothetical protein
MAGPLLKLKRFVRSPRVIVFELLAIALAGLPLSFIPQASDEAGAARFAADHPALASLFKALAFDRVVHSPWFLALIVLAAASLAVVLVEQWQRLFRQWREALSEANFRGAPFRRELDFPAGEGAPPPAVYRTSGKLGLVGTPLFHLGLMLVVLAALVKVLFSAEAALEVTEGEVVEPSSNDYLGRAMGPLGRPFALTMPVRLEQLSPTRYASGDLLGLSAKLGVQEAGGWRTTEVGVNEPLDLGAERLYLGLGHGPAALLMLTQGAEVDRSIVVLREAGSGFQADSVHPNGVLVRLRAPPSASATLPAALEVRLIKSGALLFAGPLAPGQEARLSDGTVLALAGVRYWAVFNGSRDPSRWVAYFGFLFAAIGAVLMFTLVKVDTAVVVTRADGRDRVLVALRAQRFAPIFAERFERLVQEQRRGAGLS